MPEFRSQETLNHRAKRFVLERAEAQPLAVEQGEGVGNRVGTPGGLEVGTGTPAHRRVDELNHVRLERVAGRAAADGSADEWRAYPWRLRVPR
jgi:hypothetical protein